MLRSTGWRLAAATALVSAAFGAAGRIGLDSQTTPAFDLEEATIADLQARMEAGTDTARSIAEKYLARIESVDRRGPKLTSVIEINPDALQIAGVLDAERKTRGPRGPLHGIPVLLKDNIATGDRMMTSAGSLALAGQPAPADAAIVRRLRDKGAVILGKTNLSEWANFRSTHSSSGWSARGGQTKNPYALDRSPSGSSSGSAAAIASSLAVVAIGTETDGSIVSPSGVNALVGMKPTLGLVSRTGIVPIAHSQDTAGPMARTVTDAAIVLEAIAGTDPGDQETRSAPAATRYAPTLRTATLKGARIGVIRNRLFGNSPAADHLAERAIVDLESHGAVIVDPVNIPTLGQFDATELEVLLYEFKADLAKYLQSLGTRTPVHSLKELIAFNRTRQAQEMPYFGQELFEMAEARGALDSEEYKTALAQNRRMARAEGIDAAMNAHRLDALIAPTGGPAWLIDLVNGDGGTATAPAAATVAAVAGYPHITVPMGFYRGLPMGLSFIGGAWTEGTLLRLAYVYEQATKHRKPPRFAPSAQEP